MLKDGIKRMVSNYQEPPGDLITIEAESLYR